LIEELEKKKIIEEIKKELSGIKLFMNKTKEEQDHQILKLEKKRRICSK